MPAERLENTPLRGLCRRRGGWNTLGASEFLSGITVNGLPPHLLSLKVGMIIMLLRNLRPDLANGTRLQVERLHTHVLECTVASGKHVGRRHFIQRINLKPADTNLPFTMRRRHFPSRSATR
jgi:ATP-dependent DNA helicase PIF1